MNQPENSKPPHPSLYAGMWLTHHPVSRRLYWRSSWIGRSSENSQLSMPSLRGQLMSSGLQAMGWRPSVADWGGGISVVLHRTGPIVRYCRQWMAAYRAMVPLAHANQLSLPGLWSAAIHESSHVGSAISSISDLCLYHCAGIFLPHLSSRDC